MSEYFCLRYFRVMIISWIFMYGNLSALNTLVFCTVRDSIKRKYSAIDALNPDCPCYKYQRKAEREYHHLLRKERRKKYEGSVQSGKSALVKEYGVLRSRKFFYFKRKSSHKTKSFNFSRRREKKGFLNFFKKNIAACTS